MKTYALLIMSFCLLFVDEPLLAIDTNKQISQIKLLYSQYNNEIIKYEKKEFDIVGESTEGGKLTVYYSTPKVVKKIIAIFYGETGKSITEYYVINEAPFFVFETNINYNNFIYKKNKTTQTKIENRYYFYENNMIKWLDDKGKSINSNADVFKNQEKNILADYNRLINIFYSK